MEIFIFHKEDNLRKVKILLETSFKPPLNKKLSFKFFNTNGSNHIDKLIEDCNTSMEIWHQRIRMPTIGFHINVLKLTTLNKLKNKGLIYFRKVFIQMDDPTYDYLKSVYNSELLVLTNDIAIYTDYMLFKQYRMG